MTIQVGEERISSWLVGGGLGLVVVGALGFAAEQLGWGFTTRAYLFLFVLCFGLPPFVTGLHGIGVWASHNRLDLEERERRIYGQIVKNEETVEAPPAIASVPHNSQAGTRVLEVAPIDRHTELWRGALLTAINAAAECHSYTCPDWLRLKVVDSAEAWKIVTDELARVGIVSRKVVGKATEALLEREEAIRLLYRQLLSFPAQDPPIVRLPRPPAPAVNSPESQPHAESG